VLTAVAYFQPITRAGLGDILGRKISRDVIAALRSAGLVATGPQERRRRHIGMGSAGLRAAASAATL